MALFCYGLHKSLLIESDFIRIIPMNMSVCLPDVHEPCLGTLAGNKQSMAQKLQNTFASFSAISIFAVLSNI